MLTLMPSPMSSLDRGKALGRRRHLDHQVLAMRRPSRGASASATVPLVSIAR